MLLGWGADFDKETPSRKTPVDLAYIKNDENPGYICVVGYCQDRWRFCVVYHSSGAGLLGANV